MFTYEQILDMNFPCPVEEGRMSVNPWGFYQKIDNMGWPCITEEVAKPGSSFDFVPVPTLEEVFSSLPPWVSLKSLTKEEGSLFVISNVVVRIASGKTIAEAVCDAYLYYKNISGK